VCVCVCVAITPLLNVAEQTFTGYLGIFGIFVVFKFFIYFSTISRGTLDSVVRNARVPRDPGWETLR
jgi:hypothetical protein